MRYIFVAAIYLLPLAAMAQAVGSGKDFRWVVATIMGYIKLLIPLVFALTFVVFMWGIIKAWVLGAGDAQAVEEGKNIALWGVIGLVVMSGIWGIVALIRVSFFGI